MISKLRQNFINVPYCFSDFWLLSLTFFVTMVWYGFSFKYDRFSRMKKLYTLLNIFYIFLLLYLIYINIKGLEQYGSSYLYDINLYLLTHLTSIISFDCSLPPIATTRCYTFNVYIITMIHTTTSICIWIHKVCGFPC